jgi:Tfp pilus assembly protein PilN
LFQKKEEVSYQTGIISVILMAVLMVGVYFGLVVAKNNIVRDIAVTNENYNNLSEKLSSNNKDIVDLQNRIAVAGNLLKQKNKALDGLFQLEKKVAKGAFIESYDYKNGAISINIVADNLNVLARQILSLKENDVFSDVTFKSAKINTDKKFETSLDLKIN